MWPTTDLFDAALARSSRTWRTRIEVLFGDQIVTSLNTMISGYIGLDNVAVRREAHFTITDVDGTLTPAEATDLLTPKGTEVRIYRGLKVSGDEYEDVPMGVFGVVEPEVRAHSEGTVVEIKGFDRVDKLRALHFKDPWVIAADTPIHQALVDIITSRMDVPLRVAESPYTTPALVYDRFSSPWDAIRELMAAGLYVVYFDQLGTCVIEPDVGVPTGKVYQTGDGSTLMTSSRKFLPLDTTYSGVIVRGMHPDYTPIRSELWDIDPLSPTYSLGPFGERPYGVYSDIITTQDQADAIAADTLPRVSQIRQECEITTRDTPAHDVGDIIRIIDPRSRTNRDYEIISATVPLVNEQGTHTRLRCKEA